MREILFRGKINQTESEWVEGFYNHIPCGRFMCDEHLIQTIDADGRIGQLYNVYESTVGQFTGQTDKNGKKIFEGDIIKFHKYRGEPDWTGVVKYEYCSYIAVGRMPLAYEKRIGEEPYFCPFEVQISGIDNSTINVIGNIHDNPELLEVSDDST